MTATAVGRDVDALGPVRDALLGNARREADAVREEAEQEARGLLDEAAREAESIRRTARTEGEQDAQTLRAEQQARARRRARAAVLQAQREALESLTGEVHARLREQWDDPETRRGLRQELTARALAELGPEASVTDHPDGGVLARCGSRRVEYVLSDLADDVIAGLGDLPGLWTP